MNITSAALKKLLTLKPVSTSRLLVSRAGGGCSGFVHKMGFTNSETSGNEMIIRGELQVEYPKDDSIWFRTATLDFKDGLDGTGFEWGNTAAKGCCGCKKSFC